MEPKKVIIDKIGEKKIEKLEKARKEELEKLDKEYKTAKDQILKEAGSGGKLDKLRLWKDKQIGDVTNPKYWALVNVEAMKEFVKYGANKVLDQIRVRTAANIAAREEIARARQEAKKGLDVKTVAMTFIFLAVAACIAWVMISNFFNYDIVAKENIQLKSNIGTVTGNLAACRSELAHYNPASVPPEKGPDNVLEG